MTILLPVDPETERLARKLAEATGKPLPVVVKEAIKASAEAAGVTPPEHVRPSNRELLARMIEITDGFADLPIVDPRTADEILGYGDHGVAR